MSVVGLHFWALEESRCLLGTLRYLGETIAWRSNLATRSILDGDMVESLRKFLRERMED